MKKIITFFILSLIILQGFSVQKKKESGIYGMELESLKLLPLSVNTPKSDFSPAIIGDSLFFTSFSKDLSQKNRAKSQKTSFCDLYSLQLDPQGNIAGQRSIIEEFTASYHNGPVSWCKSTGELFVTQSNYAEPGAVFNPFRKNYFNLQIIIAKQENGKWKNVASFPYNNPKYSVGHPAINQTGDTLIFSSNKPGGLGETDLYLSVRKNGEWSNPVNLGSRINTTGKDEFPTLTDRGDLIFASSGRDGMGGLDLYFTKLNDPNSAIRHFKSPINSEYDDFSMILLPGAEYGYMTSDRPGKGEDDIYKFTFDRYRDNLFELLVMDSKSGRPIPGAEVVFNDNIDLKTGHEGEISRKIEDEMSLVFNVKALGYIDESKTIQTGFLKSGEIIQDTLWMDMIVKQKVVLKNIYYDYDRADLLPESLPELDKLTAFMEENPDVRVNLSAHTDSRGSKMYNQKLSEKRVQSVVAYLLQKGIDGDRIVGKGYGESMPVNNCVDMVVCSPEDFRINRRTEFFIPELGKSESVNQKGKGDYTTGYIQPQKINPGQIKNSIKKLDKYAVIIGSFKDLPNARKLFDQLTQNGYQTEIINGADLFTVGVSYKDIKSAREGLNKLKSEFPGAWIL